MKPSQNSLFKADTCVKTVAASGFLGLVHVNIGTKEKTPQSQNKSTMSWIYWVILIVGLTILFSLILYLWIRWLVKREPYGSFVRLRTRRKLTFFRFMLREKRVPLYVKVIPVILLVYLAFPLTSFPTLFQC